MLFPVRSNRVWVGVGLSLLLCAPFVIGDTASRIEKLWILTPAWTPVLGLDLAAVRRNPVTLVSDLVHTVPVLDHGNSRFSYGVSLFGWLAPGSVRTVGDVLRLLNIPLTSGQAHAVGVCRSLAGLPSGEQISIAPHAMQSGLASWYGPGFHGQTAASGETYDMRGISAAHRTLPLGSIVRVVHRSSGKSLIVRINDRGPYIAGRILDLSQGAKEALGVGDLAAVYLEKIDPVALAVPCP